MKALLDGLKALGAARLAALGLVGLGTLTLLAMLALHGGSERMAPLYTDLDMRDAAQMAEQLERAHITHQLGSGGSEILVPASRVADARVLLAKDGLPSGGTIGYELFDRTDSLTASPAEIDIARTRALEGELARTIRAIRGVRSVRVHLVLPRREPFQRDQQEAQASVLLGMAGATRMDREGVQAVLNLIAAAVPGLKPRNIAVIDNRGDVLARAGAPVGPGGSSLSAAEIRQATELRLSRAVEEMLERSLGPGHVRAEAAVEMNFDQLRETEERYDPDGQVVRSQQSTSDKSKSSEANSSVSVQNNLPNADAGGAGGTGSEDQRQEDTTNYEISKTVRTLVHDEPQIKRVSVAVMVDGTSAAGPDGKPVWHERPQDELARITALVRSAIGFDEKRGDRVEVVSMRFAGDEDAPARPTSAFGLPLERADLLHLAQLLLFAVIGLVALLAVLRPMVQRLTMVTPAALAAPDRASEGQPALAGSAPSGALPASGGLPALPAPAGNRSTDDDRMVNLANIEGQMRASSIRKVTELVDKHPDESLAIVRSWMAQEAS